MAWDGKIETLPMVTVAVGTALHHGTDCAGDFEIPDGPAWFALAADTAAYWAGWNYTPDRFEDGERRTHAYETTSDIRLVDLAAIWVTDEDWERLCLAMTGIDDELTRDELAQAFAERGFAGWAGEEEVLLTRPAESLRFLGRTSVPGHNPLRPIPSTWTGGPAPAP